MLDTVYSGTARLKILAQLRGLGGPLKGHPQLLGEERERAHRVSALCVRDARPPGRGAGGARAGPLGLNR